MEYVHRQNVKASFESIKDEATENYPVAWAKEFSVEDNMPTSFTLANNQIVSLPISKKVIQQKVVRNINIFALHKMNACYFRISKC